MREVRWFVEMTKKMTEMDLSDLREVAKHFAGCLTTDSFKDVFHPRGVTFPARAKKLDTRTAKMSVTWWVVGCRMATTDDMEVEG